MPAKYSSRFAIDGWLTIVAIAVAPVFWLLIYGKSIERRSTTIINRKAHSFRSFKNH